MSNQDKADDKKGRITVSNLPQQEKELREQEAENIKGGGGLSGGVLRGGTQVKPVGEEALQ